MAQKSDSRGLDKVIVRLPDGMRDRIKRAAEQNGRSMNAEIVAALDEKFPPMTLNLEALVAFLEGLNAARQDGVEIDAGVNHMLAQTKLPYTLRTSGDGVVAFYPYASPIYTSDDEEEEGSGS